MEADLEVTGLQSQLLGPAGSQDHNLPAGPQMGRWPREPLHLGPMTLILDPWSPDQCENKLASKPPCLWLDL